MQAWDPTLKVCPVGTSPSIGGLVRGSVNMWQLLHSKPALACVPWVKEEPVSLWQLPHSSVTVAALGRWACGSWQDWHWMPTSPCLLARPPSGGGLWAGGGHAAAGRGA